MNHSDDIEYQLAGINITIISSQQKQTEVSVGSAHLLECWKKKQGDGISDVIRGQRTVTDLRMKKQMVVEDEVISDVNVEYH